LFHNSNVFGSCFIHILYTGCAKIKKKIISAPKVNSSGMSFKNNSQKEFITIIFLDVYGVLAVISNENLSL